MEERTTVLISYNPVKGFTSGWHGNDKLYILANDEGPGRDTGEGDSDRSRAGNVMHRISGQFYHGEVPKNNVARYYIYVGLNAMSQAISLALSLRQETSVPITVVACDCDDDVKKQKLRGFDILWSECGGRSTLQRIAEEVLRN